MAGWRTKLSGVSFIEGRHPTKKGSSLMIYKGVQPPLAFGERSRDCSKGHAGKEGPQLARTGASQGFPRAAAPVGLPRGPDSGQRLGKPADVSEESALLNPPAPSEVLLSFTPAAWAI